MNTSVEAAAGGEPFASVTVGETRVDILGTAHVSAASRDAVRELMQRRCYDAVALELCDRRYAALTGGDSLAEMDLWDVMKQRKMFSVMAMLLFGAYQRRVGEQLGIAPGAEFREAIDQAQALDVPTALIDRDIGISLQRFYRSLKWWHRPALFSGLMASLLSGARISEEELEKMKREGGFVSAVDQAWPGAASLVRVLVTERDRYMAAKLRAYIAQHRPQRVLTVIGAGHLRGMRRDLERGAAAADDRQMLDEYCRVPPRARWVRLFPWIVTAVIVAGFVIGFSRGFEVGVSLLSYWIFANGTLAALGALLAVAHPLTIATAFVAAPITSLNPLIGAGIVTAAVQFLLRKPHVSDFASVKSDVTSFAGWKRNRVTHLFLIFFFSTVGSIIGTYVGGFHIYSVLSAL